MQNTKAFRAACLSVGLATAWSPLGDDEVKADAVLQVNLSFDASTAQSHVGSAYLGLLLNDNSFATYALTAADEISDSISVPWNASDITGYVAIGTAPPANGDPDPHAWVSFRDNAATDVAFETYFQSQLLTGETEALVVAQLDSNLPAIYGSGSFIERILQVSNVRQSIGETASLVAFSEGFPAGNVTVSVESAVVPLPNAMLMGGSLLVLLSFGQPVAAWTRRLRVQ